MKFIKILILALLLNGCVTQSRMWEAHGALRISEPDSETHDYRFYIRTAYDFGINTFEREGRETLIKNYLSEICKNASIVDESFIQAGINGFGTYLVRVKCVSK
jgi:hypothetical protein